MKNADMNSLGLEWDEIFEFPADSQGLQMSPLEMVPRSWGWVCFGGGGVTGISLNAGELFLNSFLSPLRCKSTSQTLSSRRERERERESHLFEMQTFRER